MAIDAAANKPSLWTPLPTSPVHSSSLSPDDRKKKLDDEWPESIFHHVGSQSVSYLLSVQCEVLSRVS